MPVVNGFILPPTGANAEFPAIKFDVYGFDLTTRVTSRLPIGREIVAIFDTGAGNTVINSNRVDTRGMTPDGYATFSGANAGGTAPLFWVQLRFGSLLRFNIRVAAVSMPGNPPWSALLGMDFIRNGELTVDIRRGIVKLNGW
jgi:hypothetical protein